MTVFLWAEFFRSFPIYDVFLFHNLRMVLSSFLSLKTVISPPPPVWLPTYLIGRSIWLCHLIQRSIPPIPVPVPLTTCFFRIFSTSFQPPRGTVIVSVPCRVPRTCLHLPDPLNSGRWKSGTNHSPFPPSTPPCLARRYVFARLFFRP